MEVENKETYVENREDEGDFVKGGEKENWNFCRRNLYGSSNLD